MVRHPIHSIWCEQEYNWNSIRNPNIFVKVVNARHDGFCGRIIIAISRVEKLFSGEVDDE